MYLVLLTFSDDRHRATQFMEDHNTWIDRGFTDDVFVLVGTIRPDLGGAIVAHHISLTDLQRRVSQDPLVAEGIVTAKILEVGPTRTDERLEFLVEN